MTLTSHMSSLVRLFRVVLPVLLLTSLSNCSGGDDGNSPTAPSAPPPPANIAGLWDGTISSPTAASCNLTIEVDFTQADTQFIGTFSMGEDLNGSFEGTLSGNTVSGIFSSNASDGCRGTANFTGAVSGNSMQIDAPTVITFRGGCEFCQQNTVQLTRR